MSESLSRREALGRLAAAGAGVAAGGLFAPRVTAAESAAPRPNIVFILLDDLRWDVFGHMGHPFMKTPAIDRIRREGVRFDNSFVTISLCSPSRACFLTGTYAHTNGVFGNNGAEFDPAVTPSFPMLLQKAGYETAYVGKWHMAKTAKPRPGFDYWLSFEGQGVHTDPALNENGREFKGQGYTTDLLSDYADRWLRQPHAKPFCLYLAHKAVHGPFLPAERHKDLYADVDMPKPANWDDTFEGKPEWQRREKVAKPGARRDPASPQGEVPAAVPPVPWDPRNSGRLNQLRMVSAVDEGIDRLLKTLAETGQLDNTLVIFTSDNGYFHGEHRRGDKRLMYEEALRIPLVMRCPRLIKPGSTVAEMVLSIDLAPTLLDLAGATVPAVMQGRSLRPLLAGQPVAWRQSFLYEYWVDLTPAIPSMVGVRTRDWKYVRYPETRDLDELYDLAHDPAEMHNLSQDPHCADRLAQMRAELERLQKETGYRTRPAAAPAPALRSDGELVLEYTFAAIAGERVTDTSGKGNHGVLHGAKPVAGRAGGRALPFTGTEYVDVAKSASLDPSGRHWSVEAWVNPAAPDGPIVVRGGQSLGYALALRGGKPEFAVRTDDALATAAAPASCVGTWTHLVGVIADGQAALWVNGRSVAAAPLSGVIGRDPNDTMQIGRDLGSPFFDGALATAGYQGLIGPLRLYSRALTPAEIAKAAQVNP